MVRKLNAISPQAQEVFPFLHTKNSHLKFYKIDLSHEDKIKGKLSDCLLLCVVSVVLGPFALLAAVVSQDYRNLWNKVLFDKEVVAVDVNASPACAFGQPSLPRLPPDLIDEIARKYLSPKDRAGLRIAQGKLPQQSQILDKIAAINQGKDLSILGADKEISQILTKYGHKIESLTVRPCHLHPEGAVALAQSAHLKNLTSLNLSHCSIRTEGAVALAQSAYLKNLTSLNLSDCIIGPEGVAALAQSAYLQNLTSLNLSHCTIGDQGAAELARSETLKKLTSLNLSHCTIGDQGAAELARSETLKKLTSLDLSHCTIGDQGAAALARSAHLQNLTYLDLSQCSIGDEGAAALARSAHLQNLTYLDLMGNNIGPQGIEGLARFAHLKFLRSVKYVIVPYEFWDIHRIFW
jgi:Ran GTPase-activating protein (RanGAP) involved in mRNA processing and transport